MARIILAAVEERVERDQPGDQMRGLRGAADFVGEVLADALEDALFVTAGSLLEAIGADGVKDDAAGAESTYKGAGDLLLIKADDWADASEEPDLIIALGAESPETVEADAGFNRWLDRCRPGAEPDLNDLAEAAVVALAQMWPQFTRATTMETTQWWLGPDPAADQAPGGPEYRWDAIARLLLVAIDDEHSSDSPGSEAADFEGRARALLDGCNREALLEVAADALFGTAQWVELDHEDVVGRCAAMDAAYPRAGELWKAVEADLALAGGWYDELEASYEPEPLSNVCRAPALERWLGGDRRNDAGTVDYVAAALAAFADDGINWIIGNWTDDETLDRWAQPRPVGPRPRQWPPAANSPSPRTP